jgi:hypothetical protein
MNEMRLSEPGMALAKNAETAENNVNVSKVCLRHVWLVCLIERGQELLCLAQLSNTLLNQYNYNEIHNRRVALGINCIQCTPVQLEALRRSGAVVSSSRRCGVITRREAERLVKSFLDDTKPPTFPESLRLDVEHQCGWGCRGEFQPLRYTSSRAKCIRCRFCQLLFSPNKFVFHSHQRPGSGQHVEPDTTNFSSWRRHLHIVNPKSDESLHIAWEDIKAIFNGGTRKRKCVRTDVEPSKDPKHLKKRSKYVAAHSASSLVLTTNTAFHVVTPDSNRQHPTHTPLDLYAHAFLSYQMMASRLKSNWEDCPVTDQTPATEPRSFTSFPNVNFTQAHQSCDRFRAKQQ